MSGIYGLPWHESPKVGIQESKMEPDKIGKRVPQTVTT